MANRRHNKAYELKLRPNTAWITRERKLLQKARAFAQAVADDASSSVDISGKADKTTQIIAGEGLSGGGDLSVDRTLALDINELTADASPDIAADYVATYDASAAGNKKVLLDNLPFSNSDHTHALDDLSDVTITSPVSGQLLAYEASSFLALSGDMTDGDDDLLLSGDMTDGDDRLILSGDEGSAGWVNSDDVTVDNIIVETGIKLPSYTVATLPSASIVGKLIYVSDEVGGATVAFSDGTDWRRVQDRAVVS